MACGENPKRVYGERKQLPSTRMGNMAAYRAQWVLAQQYIDEFGNLAKSANTLVVPANLADLTSMIALATNVARNKAAVGGADSDLAAVEYQAKI